MSVRDKTVLVTGGTGTFGRAFVDLVLQEGAPKEVVVFSRDELKQAEMRRDLAPGAPVRFIIGDVRDERSVRRAVSGVEIVVHGAALKRVSTCEAQPIEAVLTNAIGAQNVADAAIQAGVERVVAISTDKAVQPENVYGASKLVAERIFLRADAAPGNAATRFAVARYGNVLGSRGSLLTRLHTGRDDGRVELTDQRMTRFWMQIEESARFVIRCVGAMRGGEVFVPKLRSSTIGALAAKVAPDAEVALTGVQPGEKIHESLLSEREIGMTTEGDGMYVVRPPGASPAEEPLPEGFRYSSDGDSVMLTDVELSDLVAALEK